MLPKIKVLLEGGQQLYTKNATSQGRFLIHVRDGYRTRLDFITILLVSFYQYIAYIKTSHYPLKDDQYFKHITSTFLKSHPNLLSTLGLIPQYNKGGVWLPQDSECIELNVFNQLLSPHIWDF